MIRSATCAKSEPTPCSAALLGRQRVSRRSERQTPLASVVPKPTSSSPLKSSVVVHEGWPSRVCCRGRGMRDGLFAQLVPCYMFLLANIAFVCGAAVLRLKFRSSCLTVRPLSHAQRARSSHGVFARQTGMQPQAPAAACPASQRLD